MPRKQKIAIKPKSMLGFDTHLRICYNCQWRNNEDGWCSMWQKYCNYNDSGGSCVFFRYKLEYGYRNWWFDKKV